MNKVSVFNSSTSESVQRELIDILYANSATGLAISVLAFSGLVFGFYNEQAQSMKFAFWALMLLVAMVRLGDTLHWVNVLKGTRYSPEQARYRFTIGVLGSGLIWASYAVILYDVMSNLELACTMVVLSAMAGGASSVLAPSRVVVFFYCSLLLLPISIKAVLDPEPYFPTLGTLGIMFWVAMLITGNRTHQFFTSTATVKSENDELTEKMSKEQEEIARVNRELKISNDKLDEANARLEKEVARRTDDIYRLSNRDPLTELLNRNGFIRHLENLIEKAKDMRNQVAVLFIDLDGFKQVNDSLGHQVGDAVLQEVSSRLTRFCEEDHLARWGGDEFIIALPYATVDTARAVAQAARSSITIPISVSDNQVTLDATIGIALFPEHGMNATSLIQEADLTMYEQKRKQRGSIGVFNEELFEALRIEQIMCEQLRQATANNELFVVYQPILNSRDKSLYAVEALLRWERNGIMTPPDVFIPLAERTGQMHDIGTWVLHRACIDMAHLPLPEHIGVSVNVSVIQLLDDDFVKTVKNVLSSSGLDASRLHLEITESVFSQDKNKVIASINALKTLGVSVSIDDFGTGYSSLSQLQSLQCDYVKIDRSFVQSPEEGSDTIIRATLLIAREFHCNTIAEGIETEEQAARLTLMGVDHLQGYLYAKPLTSDALITWYNNHN